jgi:small subunit ribosomal protein S6
MRTYETIFIIHPEVAGDAYTEIVDKYKGILDELGAKMIAVEEWGTRKMAYIVQKQERGTYVLFAYEGKPEGIKELERRFRIDDKVIKFMTVQLEKEYEPSGFVRKTEETSSAPAEKPAEEAPAAPAEKPAEEAPAATEAPAEEAPVAEKAEAPATEEAEAPAAEEKA